MVGARFGSYTEAIPFRLDPFRDQGCGLRCNDEELLADKAPQRWISEVNPNQHQRRDESSYHAVRQEPRYLDLNGEPGQFQALCQ